MKSLEIIPFESPCKSELYRNLFLEDPFPLMGKIIKGIFEEEREKEVDELYEEGLVEGLERSRIDELGNGEGMEVTQAGKQTIETLNAGEKIVEALELGREDRALVEEYEQQLKSRPKTAYPTRNPIFVALGVSAEKYVLNTVERVKPANLQDALLVLPFEHVEILIGFITVWAAKVLSCFVTIS